MNPFLGEIILFAGNFAPRGWALCEGQILPINQNQSLYSILGTTYGGDGRTSFALPDLRGRAPVQQGSGAGLQAVSLGEKFGSATNTLTAANLPNAPISLAASSQDASTDEPNGVAPAVTDTFQYHGTSDEFMANGAIAGAANTPVNNEQPYLALNYIIALQGVFPSRN